MPLPRPRKDESKEQWVDRCMSSDVMVDEYGDETQRYAVCISLWREAQGRGGPLPGYEQRRFELTELRAATEDNVRKIVGHAAVFDIEGDGGWFRERIAPGAFAETIERDDIRALFNHDPNIVLGRNKAGTLRLREDDRGLWIEILPPDTQAARDLMISIERGDVSQQSFGFVTLDDAWERDLDGGKDLRVLKKVRLFDVSPVTFPFYGDTDVALRSHEAWTKTRAQPGKAFDHTRLLTLKTDFIAKRR